MPRQRRSAWRRMPDFGSEENEEPQVEDSNIDPGAWDRIVRDDAPVAAPDEPVSADPTGAEEQAVPGVEPELDLARGGTPFETEDRDRLDDLDSAGGDELDRPADLNQIDDLEELDREDRELHERMDAAQPAPATEAPAAATEQPRGIFDRRPVAAPEPTPVPVATRHPDAVPASSEENPRPASTGGGSYVHFGEEIAQILHFASETIDAVTQRAQRESTQLRAAAEAESYATKKAAEEEASMVRRNAAEEAQALRAAAEADAESLRATAKQEANAILQAARSTREEARIFKQSSSDEAQVVLASAKGLHEEAERNAARIVQAARREAEELLSEARRRHQELTAVDDDLAKRIADTESVLRSFTERSRPSP
jgi:hypothetical protein